MVGMSRILSVRVKPGARASRLEELGDGSWTAHLKAPPVDGRANAELIALLAMHFDCPRSSVIIKSGAASRMKQVRINIA